MKKQESAERLIECGIFCVETFCLLVMLVILVVLFGFGDSLPIN